ncbi:hypothetical protein [Nitrosovibrio sp. Nv6]|uniref:hypothetical protein n=1 Tax=Nitrosovibrio sp. Nv6 TaxID=1855340 RepID=UPI0008AEE603|nr:hypothetical protein [Nitrosovibrio sp. Nv6]SEO45792.1 hypothetical protein SAMN05216316_0258 [Nitrosovibrio sp. Nv6]
MRILENMKLRARTFISILIMLALPLQAALAAIMPLCAQAKNMPVVEVETQISSAMPSLIACNQHNNSHEQPGNDDGAGEEDFTLSCDGVVCHISGNGLPPAASSLNFAGGFSYAISSNSRFSSFILQQPQRPPLA